MNVLIQLALRGYKWLISPLLPAACRFTPTCSEYAAEALARHGLLRGGLEAAWRVVRCNPLAKGGYDPVEKSRCQLPVDSCQSEAAEKQKELEIIA